MAALVTPTILIISRDAEVKQVATTLNADGLQTRSIGSTRELQRALQSIKGTSVAVLDSEIATELKAQATDQFEKLRGLPTLVLLTPEGDAIEFIDGERTAIIEFARKPVATSVLALRLKALILAAGLPLPAVPASTSQQFETGPLEVGNDALAQLTVVFSVKGGSGKSTIAANLAAGLSALYSHETLLVDANLWFGDIGVLLNLTSGRSSYDVCSKDDPDLFALPKAVVPHASGAAVLLRPPDPLSVEKIKLRNFVEAIERYRSLYEHVIVDCSAALDELNLDLLEKATRILLVVTPEMGAVHNTARFLALTQRLGYQDKISLVLNRSNSGISADDLQRTLGMPVSCGVVSAGRMMLEAVNEGTTLFAMDPLRRERITQDLAAIVELVAGKAQPAVERPAEPRSGGFSSRLRFLRRSA